MSCYNYTRFIKEFADRTIENLQIIESDCHKPASKEVTQLVNSLLGLLVVPSEKYKRSKEKKALEENALKHGSYEMYDSVIKLIETLEEQKKFFNNYPTAEEFPVSDFIHHLRNALCHSGNYTLLFTPIDEYTPIRTLIFYDTRTVEKVTYQFCAELTIPQVRQIISNISKMYIAVENADTRKSQKTYQKKVSQYRELMSK